MRELARKIDAFHERLGQGVSWLMLAMVMVVFGDVISRYGSTVARSSSRRPSGTLSASRYLRLAVPLRVTKAIVVGMGLGLAAGTAVAETECDSVRGIFMTMPRRNISLDGERGVLRLRVRVANTVPRRTAALRCATVEALAEAPALLDYERELTMTAPLAPIVGAMDVAYIKDDGQVISIVLAPPGVSAVAPPAAPFRYVLEVPAGTLAKHGIREGRSRATLTQFPKGGGPGKPGGEP